MHASRGGKRNQGVWEQKLVLLKRSRDVQVWAWLCHERTLQCALRGPEQMGARAAQLHPGWVSPGLRGACRWQGLQEPRDISACSGTRRVVGAVSNSLREAWNKEGVHVCAPQYVCAHLEKQELNSSGKETFGTLPSSKSQGKVPAELGWGSKHSIRRIHLTLSSLLWNSAIPMPTWQWG